MSVLLLTLYVFSLPAVIDCSGSEGNAIHIVELTPENFDEKTEEATATFHLFYADWCGHCKKLMPIYEEFCGELKSNSPQVLCSRLNCNEHKEFCEKYGIQGYPSLQRFSQKKNCVFNGERDLQSLLKWHEQSLSVLEETTDIKTLQNYIGDAGKLLIAGYFKKSGSEFEEQLISSTCTSSSVSLSLIRDIAVASKLGIPDEDGIYVIRSGKVEKKYNGQARDAEDIGKFLFITVHGILPDYSIKNSQSIFSPLYNLYVSLVFDSNHSNSDDILKTVEKVASKHTGSVRFFNTDVSNSESKNVVDYFKITKFPTLCFYDHENNKIYHFDKNEITHENVIDFVERCVAGKVESYRAKQQVPDDWDKTVVKTLVVDNFELAKSFSKNMFVMFYAPWCGHCKSMKPAWNALGEYFKNDKSVMIAHMDATLNDMPELMIQGFPTIKVFKTTGEVLDYNGGRAFEDLKSFVENGFVASKTPDTQPDKPDSSHEEL